MKVSLDRKEALNKVEKYSALPAAVLGFCLIPLLVGQLFWDLSASGQTLFTVITVLIWVVFFLIVVTKIALAKSRWEYIKSHLVEILIVLVPVMRSLVLIYAIVYTTRTVAQLLKYSPYGIILLLTAVISLGSTVIYSVERLTNPMFGNYADAVWWSFVTATTVGYGDIVPISAWGRAVAIVVMLVGVVVYSGTAGYLASLITSRASKSSSTESSELIIREIKQLRTEVKQLKQQQKLDKKTNPGDG